MAEYKRLLLAEDDEDDKMIFSEIVRSLEFNDIIQFDAVDNGRQIIQLLEKSVNLPDLVVLDQNMPQLNGKETLELLKQDARFHHIPVVIYSTYNDSRLTRECFNIGARQVITKPDSFDGFREMIMMLVDNYLREA